MVAPFMFRSTTKVFLVSLFSLFSTYAAADYSQMQWGIDKGSSPYAFGTNLGGTWYNFGTASTTGLTSLLMSGSSTPVVNLYTTPPTSGLFLANSGIFSFYPTIGNDPGDHQRAQQLMVFNPTQDATISETGISINSYINSGYASAWPGATTAVALNTLIYTSTGYVWKATTAGTTGGSLPSFPTSGATLGVTTVNDGSVVWTAQSHNQSNAKMPLFISTTAGPGAGHVWSIDTATILNSGWAGGFANGVEFDFQNNSGSDCLTCQTVFITGTPGANKIAAGISIYNGSSTNYAYQDAIVLGGTKLATQSDIRSFSASPYMIYDVGSSRTWGAYLGGNYSSGALLAFDAMREQKDFARFELYPLQAGNNNAWRVISNVNGAATDGTLVIQHSTDKFVANFTSFTFGTAGTFDTAGYTTASGPAAFVSGWKISNLAVSSTAPTISSGFGTSPSIVASNGTAAFQVNVGTGGTASSGVIGLPAATNGWSCSVADVTTQSTSVFLTKQTASTTTSVTVTNYNTAGAATAWVASDKLNFLCMAY